MAWGPWIEHDGTAMPVPAGTMVAVQFKCSKLGYDFIWNGNPDLDKAEVWDWRHYGEKDDIIRYRIHKPKGMEILEQIVRTTKLPKKCREPVSA